MRRAPASARRIATALACAMASSDARATDAGAGGAVELERIEVVGSRIRRVDLETWQPVLVLERVQLERTGLASVGDILQDLTAHGAALNTTVNNGGDGSTRVDLRNLGDNRTLVLVDGRRWIAGIDGAVDLDSIPLAMVERIEVLKDGASAIYGSDAIAGVVNVVTRRDLEGLSLLAQVGEAQAGDGRVERWEATLGASGERGGASLGVSHVQQEPIFAGDRAIAAVPTFGLPGADVRAGASPTTPFGTFGFGARGACAFDPAGNYPAGGRCTPPPGFPPGPVRSTFDPATGGWRVFDPRTDGYNFAPENYLLTPQERTALFAATRYDLGDSLRVSADALYNERRSAQQLAPAPILLSVLQSGANNLAVPADHVHNPFGQPVTGLSLRPGGQVRRFAQDADTLRVTLALEGSFLLGGRLWSWTATAVDGEQTIAETTRGLVNPFNLRQALGPTFRDAQGTPRCGTPQAPIPGCVPLDAFRGPAAFTADMLSWIYYVGKESTRTTARQYALGATGDLVDLPAGPLAVAVGSEYRRETGRSQLDAFRVAIDNLADTSFSGGLAVREAYVELSVPLLAQARLAEALDLSLAARRSRYDAFGSTTNGEAGLQYRPRGDLLLRGGWSEGFRAPIVSELFLPVRGGSGDPANDPCNVANATTAQQRAGCIADGVPGGAYTPDLPQFSTRAGGNPDLQPEQAVTRTLGLVYSPAWLAGFDASLDWYEIEVEDAILAPDVRELLRSCIDAQVPEACARTTRAASGDLLLIDGRLLNSGLLAVEGYDLLLRWRGDTPLGALEIAWDSSYTARYEAEIPRGAAPRSAVGNNATFEPGFRIRSNLDLAWRRGAWSASVAARWYSGLDEPCIAPSFVGRTDLCSDPGIAHSQDPRFPENRLGTATYVDLQAGWDAPWGSRLVAGVHNAFDRDPPVSYAAFANSFDPAYPIPGRFFYLRLTHDL